MGGHYGGLNFFEGDKKMYSVSRTRKKNPFVFVAAAVYGMWSECGQSCLDIWSQHLACWMLTEQWFGILFRNERKHHIRVPFLNVYIPSPNLREHFTFMSPCIVIEFFLNNQTDALIIQIYSVIKLYMFRVSKQSQVGNAFQPDSAWKRSSKTCMKLTCAECTVENS